MDLRGRLDNANTRLAKSKHVTSFPISQRMGDFYPMNRLCFNEIRTSTGGRFCDQETFSKSRKSVSNSEQ